MSLCEQGDKLLEEETAKVYNSKKVKVTKGMHPPSPIIASTDLVFGV